MIGRSLQELAHGSRIGLVAAGSDASGRESGKSSKQSRELAGRARRSGRQCEVYCSHDKFESE
jgi:hypothetical protein